MKSVGTKALKDNLSKYLRMVREGETILVTDRDEVIAEIHRPSVPVAGRVSRWEAFLNEEVRRGRMTRPRAGNSPPFARLRSMKRPATPINLESLLEHVKAD